MNITLYFWQHDFKLWNDSECAIKKVDEDWEQKTSRGGRLFIIDDYYKERFNIRE